MSASQRIELQRLGNRLTGSLRLKWLSPEWYSGNLNRAVAQFDRKLLLGGDLI